MLRACHSTLCVCAKQKVLPEKGQPFSKCCMFVFSKRKTLRLYNLCFMIEKMLYLSVLSLFLSFNNPYIFYLSKL